MRPKQHFGWKADLGYMVRFLSDCPSQSVSSCMSLSPTLLSSSCQSVSQLIRGLIRGWLCADCGIPKVTLPVTRQPKVAEAPDSRLLSILMRGAGKGLVFQLSVFSHRWAEPPLWDPSRKTNCYMRGLGL